MLCHPGSSAAAAPKSNVARQQMKHGASISFGYSTEHRGPHSGGDGHGATIPSLRGDEHCLHTYAMLGTAAPEPGRDGSCASHLRKVVCCRGDARSSVLVLSHFGERPLSNVWSSGSGCGGKTRESDTISLGTNTARWLGRMYRMYRMLKCQGLHLVYAAGIFPSLQAIKSKLPISGYQVHERVGSWMVGCNGTESTKYETCSLFTCIDLALWRHTSYKLVHDTSSDLSSWPPHEMPMSKQFLHL